MNRITLAAFAADKNSSLLYVPDDVVTDFLAGLELEIDSSRIVHDVRRVGSVEAFDTEEKPGNAAFQKSESNIWEFFQNAVENDRSERNHLTERVRNGVYGGIGI